MDAFKTLVGIISSQINALQNESLEDVILNKKSLGIFVSYVNYLVDKNLPYLHDKQKKSIKKILMLESFSNCDKKYPVITILKLCNKYFKEKDKDFIEGKNIMRSFSLYYLHLDSYESPSLLYFLIKKEYKKIAI